MGDEAVDMLLILGECQRNYRRAEQLYAQRYPERRPKSRMAFFRLERRARVHNSLSAAPRDRQCPVTNNDRANQILAMVQADPTVSTHQISTKTGISQSSVWRILNRYDLHPYHLSLHQHLTERDFDARRKFCNRKMENLEDDAQFCSKILLTDEATFKDDGLINGRITGRQKTRGGRKRLISRTNDEKSFERKPVKN